MIHPKELALIAVRATTASYRLDSEGGGQLAKAWPTVGEDVPTLIEEVIALQTQNEELRTQAEGRVRTNFCPECVRLAKENGELSDCLNQVTEQRDQFIKVADDNFNALAEMTKQRDALSKELRSMTENREMYRRGEEQALCVQAALVEALGKHGAHPNFCSEFGYKKGKTEEVCTVCAALSLVTK